MKNKKHVFILIVFLIIIEQGIKLIINYKYLNSSIPIIKPFIYFEPLFNRDYSWFNNMLQLGVGKWIHVVFVTLMIIIIFLFYKFLNKESTTTRLADAAFIFLLAGAACSLIDKLFWNGSLDYICLKNLFTFDLKDVYINVFIGLLILMVVINHNNFRQIDDKKIIGGFIRYLFGR